MTEHTDEELKLLGAAFKEMGVKPKCDSPADLKQWMKTYVKSSHRFEPTADKDKADRPAKEMMVTQSQLRISNFSGETSKTDVAYEVWRFEVDCLVMDNTYSKSQIMQAARRSLKGEASGIAVRLGATATLDELLARLEGAYGTVDMGETLMSQFYAAQQQETESVTAWSCRLEDILMKANQYGKTETEDTREMLRSKFWRGLRSQLKETSRFKFDAEKDYEKLRLQIRAIERELQAASSEQQKEPSQQRQPAKGQVKSAVAPTTTETSEIAELKGMVKSLTTAVDAIKKEVQWLKRPPDKQQKQNQAAKEGNKTAENTQESNTNPKNKYNQGCWHCGQQGHLKRNCRILLQQIQEFEQNQQQQLNFMGRPSWGSWPSPSNLAPTAVQSPPQGSSGNQQRPT